MIVDNRWAIDRDVLPCAWRQDQTTAFTHKFRQRSLNLTLRLRIQRARRFVQHLV
jgi:hypothetical protein